MNPTDKQTLANAGIDVDGALERFMGNEALLVRFLGKFPDDPNFFALEAAIAAGNCDAAFTAAHTLKGVCGNLSMTALFDTVSRQTERLRGGDLAAAAGMMEALRSQYQAVCSAIGTAPVLSCGR